MKSLVTILLLTTIFLETLSSFGIRADYLLNKSFIAKVLCINKEKPKMHCNGKCYLAKQLKEQEQQEQQAPNQKKEKFDVEPFYLPKQFSFTIIDFSTNTEFRYTNPIVSSVFLRSVFHPPTV